MTAYQMPRKNATYRLDQRLVEEIQSLAKEQNTSSNRWLENALITLFRTSGRIPSDFQPLGETRGGKRSEARKPKSQTGDELTSVDHWIHAVSRSTDAPNDRTSGDA